MLPILKDKKKSIADVITASRRPSDEPEEKSEHSDGMLAAAQDLINALKSEDVHAVASALKAAQELADAEPHIEGEHIDAAD